MRLVQVTIPTGKRNAVLDLLNDEGVDYVVTDESSSREYDAVVYFPVPTNAVEPIMDALRDIGLDRESYTVVVDAETVMSERFDELQDRYATESVEEEQISRHELITRADDLTPAFSVFLTMTAISAIVATAGLLLDSPAVVVGSMVIAPLIGPALATAVGTVVNEPELFMDGVRYQLLGVAVAIVGSAMFAWAIRTLFLVPPSMSLTQVDEIARRFSPDLLLLPVAIGAGAAGILSLSTGFSVALVGVMIAAALIPPIAAAGIAIAWGLPMAAAGSTVLVLVNLLGVNLAGLLTLWYTGYRPGSTFEISLVHRHLGQQVLVLVVAVLVLSVFLAGTTYTTYQLSTFEGTAAQEAEAALEPYNDLDLLSVSVELHGSGSTYRFGPSLDATERIELVEIEVGGPPGSHDSDLVEIMEHRINRHTEEDIVVRVRFVTSVDA